MQCSPTLLAARVAALIAAGLLAIPPIATAQIATNAFVSPCINTFVSDGNGKNICILEQGNIILDSSIAIGVPTPTQDAQAGWLHISGGQLTVNTSIAVGTGAATGELALSGSGKLFLNAPPRTAASLLAGWYGNDGTIDIASGSTIFITSDTGAFTGIGQAASKGTLTITGGTLNMDAPNASLGIGMGSAAPANGSSAVAVRDNGSLVINGEHLDVGFLGGQGQLSLRNGGSVQLTRRTTDPVNGLFYMNVGLGANASGNVTIDQASLTIDGNKAGLNIGGGGGVGTLAITGDNAKLVLKGTDSLMNVGAADTPSTAMSTLTVDNNAKVEITGRGIGVGETGNAGNITITKGGSISVSRDIADSVNGFYVSIGAGQNSLGNLTVDSAGGTDETRFSMTGDNAIFTIGGGGGQGDVMIQGSEARFAVAGDAAQVNVGYGNGSTPAFDSTFTVKDGAKASIAGGGLTIGSFGGKGTLSIENGGQLTLTRKTADPDHYFAFVLASGSAQISGANSSLTLNGSQAAFNIGSQGDVPAVEPTMQVFDGGKIFVFGDDAFLEVGNGAKGTLELRGKDTQLSVTGKNAAVGIGLGNSDSGPSGTLIVKEEAHALITGTFLAIGSDGARGTLDVSAKGVITVDTTGYNESGLIIGTEGGTGFLTVDGDGSKVDVIAPGSRSGVAIGEGVGSYGEVMLTNKAMLSVTGNKLDSSIVVASDGSGIVGVKSGSTLHLDGAKLYIGTQAGSGTMVIGDAAAGTRSLLEVKANGVPIEVRHGSLTINSAGDLDISVQGAKVAMDSSAVLTKPESDSHVMLKQGSTVRLASDSWSPSSGGETMAFAIANRIGYSDTELATRRADLPARVTLDTSGVARSAGLFLAPETIRVGCTGSLTGSCGTDVLGLRTVKQAGFIGTPAPTVPQIWTLDAADTFVGASRTLDAALLASAAYSAPSANLLSYIDVNGLRAFAVADEGQITITIRGTENKAGTALPNWGTNLGFTGDITDAERAYLQNLSQFTASVISANPTAKIRFVGHSLGGGLAMALGAVTGFDAYAFNAPGAGNLLDNLLAHKFDLELSPLVDTGLLPARGGDFFNLVNVSGEGDIVSNEVPAPHVGQRIVLADNAFQKALVACNADAANCGSLDRITQQYSSPSRLLEFHSIDFLLHQMITSPAIRVQQNGQDVDTRAIPAPTDHVEDYIWDARPEQLNGTFAKLATASDTTNESIFANRSVSAYLPYFLAPGLSGRSLLFVSDAGSPLFRSLRVPDLGDADLLYLLEIMQDGQWQELATLHGLDEFLFEDLGGVSTFRLLLSNGSSLAADAFYDISFMTSGIFDGRISVISPVPEPRTIVMLLLGLIMLGWRTTTCPRRR